MLGEKIILLITPGFDFVKVNAVKIVFALGGVGAFLLAYTITTSSLEKLKPEIISYYPFDKFFPKSGKWSVIYFIITIILLGILVYAIIKGGFYFGPA
jgi:hypothetical protein